MFKKPFLKLVVAVCICLMSAVCSYGQGGGIIDVVFRQNTAETHELTVSNSVKSKVKLSLITSSDFLSFEAFLNPGEILTKNLPSGTYQLSIVEYNTTGRNTSYFLRLED